MPHTIPFKLSKSKLTIAILCATLSVGSAIVSSNLPVSANNLRLENPNSSVLPKAVAKKLIQQIAKETNLSPNNFKITEVKPAEFNGCLGIYQGPRQKCTENLIYGWKAIVTSPTQSYVYHLDRNATRIIRNTTASGAKPPIRVSFETLGNISPIASNVIFSSRISGDLSGRMSNTVLTNDGKIILYQSSPTARFAPQLIKTLSPEQINTVKTSLENQRFPNLNGLTYLTSASLADYPTTTYQAQGSSVQFIDLEKKKLPRSLQRTISTWETLIQK